MRAFDGRASVKGRSFALRRAGIRFCGGASELDWGIMADTFFQAVYEVVRTIPYGRVMTYGDIARTIGFPRRARFVGYAMRVCPEDLPWHRVVKADGSIAGGGFAPVREMLLKKENVPFLADGRVDLSQCRIQIGQ